ncbi:hypothetical protein FVA95_24010 [Pseudonocardia sp. EV170527-09]|uniref:hypothetical protein n=1 Tax=Pseudonocardia sp. EV170527-09 TaxID=2603411 RepID=UPI0011F0ECBB|nr:hypothetical protein [Pseudonocardia sp. EV170527-09]KAA1018282.1 hypothetical protein FVA95_24010 [Pseudonocardia sp. EV170527-09]
MNKSHSSELDHGLIEPISVPTNHRIPDPWTGTATPGEYDRYFRLARDDMDLAEWTRSCLDLNARITDDLEFTSLDENDKRAILIGLVTVQSITMSRWLTTLSRQPIPSEREHA